MATINFRKLLLEVNPLLYKVLKEEKLLTAFYARCKKKPKYSARVLTERAFGKPLCDNVLYALFYWDTEHEKWSKVNRKYMEQYKAERNK